MLFKITSETVNSKIFTLLNDELGYFLSQLNYATDFDNKLFTEKIGEAIFKNNATCLKFRAVWEKIVALPNEKRTELANFFKNNQDLQYLFSEIKAPLPAFPDEIKKEFSELTKHLFEKTAQLSSVNKIAGETLGQYYKKFKEENGCICIFCGLEELPQHRPNVPPEDQWRADNDHLLAKKHYPIFAVHPDNLIPTCHICNTKAKHGKDILRDQKNCRTISFYPKTESAEAFVKLELDATDEFPPRVFFKYVSDDVGTLEKLKTWNETYRIKERVDGKYASFIEKLDEDCTENSCEAFIASLDSKKSKYRSLKKERARFWDWCLYNELLAVNDNNLMESIWQAIQAKKDDANAKSEFQI